MLFIYRSMPSYLPLFDVCSFSPFLANTHICLFQISICFCASIFRRLCVSVHPPNIFTYVNAHLSLHPSLFASRVCPLVLLAWCLMEPVPHTSPLRDPAAMEPLIHQSPCSWQETDSRGTVPTGRLQPRWVMGQVRACVSPLPRV